MRKFDKKEPREPMVVHLPPEEMAALRLLNHRTGISRTGLIRQALGMLLKQHGDTTQIGPINRKKAEPESTPKTHRHAREFLHAPLAELYPENKYGRGA